MPIEDLLEKMRPDEVEAPQGAISELIERARNVKPDREGFQVEVDDAVFTVELVQLTGPVFRDVEAVNPPRQGSAHDYAVGFNCDALVRAYPVRSTWHDGEEIATVLVDGEPVTSEQWAELTRLLGAAGLEDAATVVWAIHYGKPRERLAELQMREDAK